MRIGYSSSGDLTIPHLGALNSALLRTKMSSASTKIPFSSRIQWMAMLENRSISRESCSLDALVTDVGTSESHPSRGIQD